MKLRIRTNAGELARSLRERAHNRLPAARHAATLAAAQQWLKRTIEETPVRSGRTRSAWVTAVRRLGGTAPAGWEGSQADGDAIAEGARQVDVQLDASPRHSAVQVSNQVEYAVFLELGTRRMRPFRMVRRALAAVRNDIVGRFRLLFRKLV